MVNKILSFLNNITGNLNLLNCCERGDCCPPCPLFNNKTRQQQNLETVILGLLPILSWQERQQIVRCIRDIADDRMLNKLDFPYSDLSLMMLQSGEEVTEIHGSNTTANTCTTDEKLTTFTDSDCGNSFTQIGYPDATYWKDYTPEADLQDWLKRPIRIQRYTWSEGAQLNEVIYPWRDYLNEPSVKNKIQNYSYLQANLHIKLVINASPFYYGFGMMAYRPLQVFTPSTIAPEFTNSSDGYYMALSQRPHIKFFPQTCEGGEMVLPFFYHKDWLNITNLNEVRDMGELEMYTPISLQQANGVVGSGVSVSVFAWMENVKLSGATVAPALQGKDEYGDMKGPVSKPASAIAKVANALSSAPYIGPFARATGMIATGIGSIASLLGYTNVPVIKDVDPVKSLVFHSFASTEISQPVEKLSIDPKNELTIDNRVAGLDGIDELMMSKWITHETYETFFNWSTARTPDEQLFLQYVSPEITTTKPIGTVFGIQRTPLSHLAKMFAYWRGSMVYRFKIIKTKYHSGRLLIQWDPQGNLETAGSSVNLVMTKVIDISETDDFEIIVPYHQPTHYQRTLALEDPENTSTYYGQSTPSVPAYGNTVFNGRLTVKVLSVLTAPVEPSTIQIAVFVRGGDDFEFANPIEINPKYSMWRLQSGEENGENLVFHGERLHSLRQLLRRTCFIRHQAGNNDGAANFVSNWTFRHALPPPQRGFDLQGINNAVNTLGTISDKPYNFCKMVPYSWISPCFIGYRGSHIWHYNVNALKTVGQIRAIRDNAVITDRGQYATTNGVSDTAGWNLSRNAANAELQLSGASGQSVTNQITQSGLSVLYPMYSRFRFRTTNKATLTLGAEYDDSKYEAAKVTVQTQTDTQNNLGKYMEMSLYHSIGTDFSFQFFINVPSVYLYDTPTPF